jgi:hypothetical protein
MSDEKSKTALSSLFNMKAAIDALTTGVTPTVKLPPVTMPDLPTPIRNPVHETNDLLASQGLILEQQAEILAAQHESGQRVEAFTRTIARLAIVQTIAVVISVAAVIASLIFVIVS